jgi:hypothetical protein
MLRDKSLRAPFSTFFWISATFPPLGIAASAKPVYQMAGGYCDARHDWFTQLGRLCWLWAGCGIKYAAATTAAIVKIYRNLFKISP